MTSIKMYVSGDLSITFPCIEWDTGIRRVVAPTPSQGKGAMLFADASGLAVYDVKDYGGTSNIVEEKWTRRYHNIEVTVPEGSSKGFILREAARSIYAKLVEDCLSEVPEGYRRHEQAVRDREFSTSCARWYGARITTEEEMDAVLNNPYGDVVFPNGRWTA